MKFMTGMPLRSGYMQLLANIGCFSKFVMLLPQSTPAPGPFVADEQAVGLPADTSSERNVWITGTSDAAWQTFLAFK